jgi:hypothetical protein
VLRDPNQDDRVWVRQTVTIGAATRLNRERRERPVFPASVEAVGCTCKRPLAQPCWKRSTWSLRRRRTRPPKKGGALHRIIFTIRRTARLVGASIAVELALDFGAGAVAVAIAPFVGTWVYAVAGVIVVGSLPVLGLNIVRVARREWKRHAVFHGEV